MHLKKENLESLKIRVLFYRLNPAFERSAKTTSLPGKFKRILEKALGYGELCIA